MKITWSSSRIDDIDAVGGHEAPLRVGYVAANGSTLGERSHVVVAECFAAPACIHDSNRKVISYSLCPKENKWPTLSCIWPASSDTVSIITTSAITAAAAAAADTQKIGPYGALYTFTDEDVTLNVDDIVFSETVHGNLGFGVALIVVDKSRGNLFLRAPASETRWWFLVTGTEPKKKKLEDLVTWPFNHPSSFLQHTQVPSLLNSLLPPKSNTNVNHPSKQRIHARKIVLGNREPWPASSMLIQSGHVYMS